MFARKQCTRCKVPLAPNQFKLKRSGERCKQCMECALNMKDYRLRLKKNKTRHEILEQLCALMENQPSIRSISASNLR
jgi:hypothetical protein